MADVLVVQIFLARGAGTPMESVEEADAIEGRGLAGDRYAAGIGTYSGWSGGGRSAGRHVTLVEAEVAAAVGVEACDLRRNIVTSGIRLHDLVGLDFGIGGALLRGVRPCEPCALLEERTGRALRGPLRGRGGLRADVLGSGTIRVGDAVAAVTADSHGADRMLRR